ncbi:unnamed protein product [Camellia sinensis]
MAETPEPVPEAEIGSETKRIVNPRAEIDTSPPFGSVKEAVTRFGGSGSWIPLHLLRLAAAHHGFEEFELDKVEEQAAELEKDLLVKERQTLRVLKELEDAKKLVEGLKMKFVKDVSECMATPELNSLRSLSLCPDQSPALILTELNQTKLNLNKTTTDLSAIRAYVESLNNKMKKQIISREKPPERDLPNPVGALPIEEKIDRARGLANDAEIQGDPKNSTNISRHLQELNFEAVQFKKIAEAAKYEVIKAMSEIEQTKTSINVVEMRLIAARKMEEAARAVEAVAFAEMKARSSSECSSEARKPQGVTLSFEEYSSLTQKAHIFEELSNRKARNAMYHNIDEANVSEVSILKKEVQHGKKSEEAFFGGTPEHSEMRCSGHNSVFKSQSLDGNESKPINEKPVPVLRSSISIGDVLSRKLILQDDFVVGRHVEGHNERQQVSLSQMLREQSGLISRQSKKGVKDGIVHKQFFSQRKKFGFIDISLPLKKQSKKKTQASNLR